MYRIVRKKKLEILLGNLKPHPNPKLFWEQYTISPDAAAEILYKAEYTFGDISGKRIIDLGCGTGRLSLGASILNAKEVFGVDIDASAIAVAKENQSILDLKTSIQWIISDLYCIRGYFDTVIQNPPFGVKRKGLDRKFIEKALEIGKTVYTIHLSNIKNREFIRTFVETCGGKITHLFQLKLDIPWMFPFHKKKRKRVIADLYRMVKL